MKKHIFPAVMGMAACFSAFASPPSSIETWDDLQMLILTNGVTSIDDLLARLPKDYTEGFTLIYRTRALGQERVSPRRPRVLLFGRDAKFVLAYNSHVTGGQSKPGDEESIETLAFDDATGRSYLREIPFNGRAVPDLSRVEVNPDRCLACHAQAAGEIGADPEHAVRGLWDPYNSWSGVYGSLSRENIDFIKLDTTEYSNFQQFLQEKSTNPRYGFLDLRVGKLSELPASSFVGAVFDPQKMNDAMTFSDGYGGNPNPMLGMLLADYNFRRVGGILADLEKRKRAAFQYLVKGISLDESFVRQDVDSMTNPTNLFNKTFSCLEKISSFLPESMPKVSFDSFSKSFLAKLRADYAVRKSAVEVDNMGLSKLGAGFDPTDPYDEDRPRRGLVFDSVDSPTYDYFKLNPKHPGYTGLTALYYVIYLMDLPAQDYSTGITRGDNVQVDPAYFLSGSTNVIYGNSSRCYTPDGQVKSTVIPYDIKHACFSDPVEEFFTGYLPARFFQDDGQALDAALDALSCDDLAAKSKAALAGYFAAGGKSD